MNRGTQNKIDRTKYRYNFNKIHETTGTDGKDTLFEFGRAFELEILQPLI